MGKGYKITSATRQNRLGPAGRLRQVYVVWLETDLGSTGSVEITPQVWDSDGLESALDSEAERLDRAFAVTDA